MSYLFYCMADKEKILSKKDEVLQTRIPWTEHISNEEVLKKMITEKTLVFKIRKRHLKFKGHITRMDDLENLTLTGQMAGGRIRGKQ